MEVIDGSSGEGGGQILRSTLALSMITGRPVRLVKIRAGRAKPGLMRQHLASIHAARDISGAVVHGDELRSSTLDFTPGTVQSGTHRFAVGTAGSSTLVFQTVLPALLVAAPGARWSLIFEGGTHNPMAPPFEAIDDSFLPLLRRMGARITAQLERCGFYPAGGGRFKVEVEAAELEPIEIEQRGEVLARRAVARVSQLPLSIAERELDTAAEILGLDRKRDCKAVEVDSLGPGNAITLHTVCEALTEVATGFGEKGVPAERVARTAAFETKAWLDSGAAVGPHLADQLLLPMALAGGGSFTAQPLTLHATTQVELIRRFLEVPIAIDPIKGERVRVKIGR